MDIKNISNVNKVNKIDNPQIQNKNINKQGQKKDNPAAIFQKSKPEDKGHVYDKSMINKLKMDSNKTRAQLEKMVSDLLRKQDSMIKILDPKATVEVDEATRTKAQSMISSDGELGVEAVSNKIVDFAKAISGGDKEKLETLKGAIEKGFKEAERILGGTLPDISQKTYDTIMDKLDKWGNE